MIRVFQRSGATPDRATPARTTARGSPDRATPDLATAVATPDSATPDRATPARTTAHGSPDRATPDLATAVATPESATPGRAKPDSKKTKKKKNFRIKDCPVKSILRECVTACEAVDGKVRWRSVDCMWMASGHVRKCMDSSIKGKLVVTTGTELELVKNILKNDKRLRQKVSMLVCKCVWYERHSLTTKRH